MNLETLNSALTAKFPQTLSPDSEMLSLSELLSHLNEIGRRPSGTETLLELISSNLARVHPAEFSMLCFLDSCCGDAIRKTGYPKEVECQLISATLRLAQVCIVEGVEILGKNHEVLQVIESLMEVAIGWNELRGKSKQNVERMLNESMEGLCMLTNSLRCGEVDSITNARNRLIGLLARDIHEFSADERLKIGKLEQRLVDAEVGQMKTVRSKRLAAEMLNSKMMDQLLTEPIVKFLHGAWFDSLQLNLNRFGLQSHEWQKATKLTETLILTLQPQPKAPEAELEPLLDGADVPGEDQNEGGSMGELAVDIEKPASFDSVMPGLGSQDLYRILEHLPDELSCLLYTSPSPRDS